MFNLYQTMNRHNDQKESKEPDVIGHDRFCQERPSRSSFRKPKRKTATRRAQSAMELDKSALVTAQRRRQNTLRSRSASTEERVGGDSTEDEKTPLMAAHSLARLLLGKSLKTAPERPQSASGRYQYTALDADGVGGGNSASPPVELERCARARALAVCQQYIERSGGRYELLRHLNDIGSRTDKHWFLVRDLNVKTERLLTLVPVTQRCPIARTPDNRDAILELFRSLQHPYIYPVLDLELDPDVTSTYAVLVVPYNNDGSLRDLIDCSRWYSEGSSSSGTAPRGAALPLSQVQRLGRQLLEALLFLRERGFPPCAHLHSGNIILQNGVARLAGLENTLLGLSPHTRQTRTLAVPPAAIDVVCFGHVLFEMAAGYELSSPEPTPGHLQLDLERCPQVADVLELIFRHPDGRYPSVEELLLCDLFRNIDLREMRGSALPALRRRLASPARLLLTELRRAQYTPRRARSASEDDDTFGSSADLVTRDRRRHHTADGDDWYAC